MTRRNPNEESRVAIALTVNGEEVAAQVEPRNHLADFLREELLLTGTHLGCEQGVCGACTVMIDGAPARSCLTLAASCDGASVRTVESFEEDALMARLREAFSRRHALQCGFCTPGVLATAYDIVRRLPDADDARIRRELSGNLCRCTGYQGMVEAIGDVLRESPPPAEVTPSLRGARRPIGMDQAAPTPSPVQAPSEAGAAKSGLEPPTAIEGGVALSRSLTIAAPVEAVWPVLRDPEALASCIPGAALEDLTPGDPVRAEGAILVSLGAVRARFAGVADIRYRDEAQAGEAIGRGRDRITRSQLDGALEFALAAAEDDPQTSKLKLEMRYRLSGPLAQFGRPSLVAALADELLSQTSANITARAAGLDAPPPTALKGFPLLWKALGAMLGRLRGGERGRR